MLNKTPIKMNQVSPEIDISPSAESPEVTPSIVTRPDAPSRLQPPPRGGSFGVASIASVHSTRSSHTVDPEYREKLDLLKTSQARKEYLGTVKPPHSKLISGWTTKGYYASAVKDCPPGMESLVNLRKFFVSKAGFKFDKVFGHPNDLGLSKYQIFNANGHVNFLAVETIQDFDSYPLRIRDVNLTVTGDLGGVVLRIEGTNKVVQIKNDAKNLGTIKRYGFRPHFEPSYKYWSYIVFNADGNEVCRFDRRKSQGTYKLYYPGIKEPIGEARDTWDPSTYTSPDTRGPHSNVFGVDLDTYATKFNPEQKALILAATVLIYDNYIREENFGQNRKRFKFGFFYNSSIALFILLLTIAVIVAILNSKAKPNHCPPP